MIFSIMNWNSKHPFLANITGSLIDPGRKEIRGLSILTFLLLIGSFASTVIVTYAMQTGPVNNLNLLVFNLVESIQSPPFDWLLQWLSNLGDRDFILVIIVGLCIWLALQKQWIAIIYLLAAYLGPLLILFILKWTISLPNPPIFYSFSSFNLPSGHTALSISVYGFIAILLARDFSERSRLAIYINVAWLVGMIGFTRLYFSTHWLTDVLAGFLLGLAWLSFLAIAYRQHHKQDILSINAARLVIAFILVLAASFPYHFSPRQIHEGFEQYYVMPYSAWQDTGWQTMDTKRNDLQNKNRHPFNIQWSANEKNITDYLTQHEWQFVENDSTSYFQWFNPVTTLQQLPVLAHIHNGQYDSIRAYKVLQEQNKILVIRLWATDILVEKQNQKEPLWIGNVSFLKLKDLFLLNYLYTDSNFNQPLEQLKNAMQNITVINKTRIIEENKNWNGELILLSE